jgi:hypothetical protein
VLSHVADQPAFMRKIAGLLRPGGHFIIATQNRPALQRNRIPPPKPGQLRHWVDRHELRSLLAAQFEVVDLLSITPIFDHRRLRIPNSYKLDKLATALHLDVVNTVIKRTGKSLARLDADGARPQAGVTSAPVTAKQPPATCPSALQARRLFPVQSSFDPHQSKTEEIA